MTFYVRLSCFSTTFQLNDTIEQYVVEIDSIKFYISTVKAPIFDKIIYNEYPWNLC